MPNRLYQQIVKKKPVFWITFCLGEKKKHLMLNFSKNKTKDIYKFCDAKLQKKKKIVLKRLI